MQQLNTNRLVNAFSISRLHRISKSIQPVNTVQSVKEVPPPEPEKKKMKWGEPVWFFFHTMAEKVNPESFPKIRLEFLKIVSSICRNLPCPMCSQHAASYLDNFNINTIQTKEQLIDFFYAFHNEVNRRKGFQEFPRELLHDKYSKANTINIINHFLIHFLDKSYSIRMIAEDFHRKRLVVEIKTWLSTNLQHFQP
jgi:hypothetical protein